jgi:hypothetical protein
LFDIAAAQSGHEILKQLRTKPLNLSLTKFDGNSLSMRSEPRGPLEIRSRLQLQQGGLHLAVPGPQSSIAGVRFGPLPIGLRLGAGRREFALAGPVAQPPHERKEFAARPPDAVS